MKKNIRLAAAVALALSSVSFAQQAVQWRVEDGGNGHWYALRWYPDTGRTFAQAQADAVSAGAHLATATSSAENEWMKANVVVPNPSGTIWAPSMGGRKVNGAWTWITGEPWSFTAWGSAEPTNDGPNLQYWRYGALYWNDHPDWNDKWLVEWSADCNGDGIVDYGQCRDGSLPDYNGNNVPDCCEAGTTCVVGNYPVEWRAEDGGNGHWYQSLPCPGCCFSSAVQSARNVGAHLATLTTAGEQARLIPVIPIGQAAKLGGFRFPDSNQFSGWQWTTGEAFSPSLISWADGNPGCCGPNQFWLYLQNTPGPGSGLHDGFDCSPTGADMLLLEWSADCNNDGLVDKGQILRGQLADSDNDGVPNVCECVCDVFRDFNVNGIDLGILLGQWGPANQFTVTDFNQDGSVDGSDLGVLLGAWGPCPN